MAIPHFIVYSVDELVEVLAALKRDGVISEECFCLPWPMKGLGVFDRWHTRLAEIELRYGSRDVS